MFLNYGIQSRPRISMPFTSLWLYFSLISNHKQAKLLFPHYLIYVYLSFILLGYFDHIYDLVSAVDYMHFPFFNSIKECSPYIKQVFLLYHWASLVTLRSLLALYPWEDP